MRLLNRLSEINVVATFRRKAANRHRQRTGRTLFLQRMLCSYAVASGQEAGWLEWQRAVRTRKRGQLRFLVTPESLLNAMMEKALETGKQQDVLELAQLAPGELRTLLQPFSGLIMAKRYTHVAYSLLSPARNRYNRAFCPAVRAASRRTIFLADPLR